MLFPLSRTSICAFGCSESLFASTQPAVAPPTMTKSAALGTGRSHPCLVRCTLAGSDEVLLDKDEAANS
jgi:hypothetical protein